MSFRNLVGLGLILFLGGTISCKKSNSGGSSGSRDSTIVYVSGYAGTLGLNPVAATWINGKEFDLPGKESVTSTYLADTTLYLLSGDTYWKNWIPMSIPEARFTKQIRVSGSDVYVAGATIASSALGYGTTAAGIYFKNGAQVNLTSQLPNVVAASVNGIAMSGTDVYAAAYLSVGQNDTNDAVYWKNGALNYLQQGYMAKVIAVSGSDVYVAGTPIHGSDVYWKNGVMNTLGPDPAIVNCITVSGSDVYIGGTTWGQNKAVYWKNGVEVNLPEGYTVNDIAVLGSDIYVAGNTNSGHAVYWKNGVVDTLGIGGANAIAVRKYQAKP